jgi:Methyltransferase domain
VKRLDVTLRDMRFRQTARYIRAGARVLDIGVADGAWFTYLGDRLGYGVGLEPDAEADHQADRWEVRKGPFPDAVAPGETFDVVTMLAVLEHIEPDAQRPFACAVANALVPEGLAVITVPAPTVDRILDVLIKLRMLDGMEAGQHYGYDPMLTVPLFESCGFRLLRHRRFELRLNHLFVFGREN